MHWLDWLYAALCVALLVAAGRWARGVLATPALPPGEGLAPVAEGAVSIIVAARDEAEHIEASVRSMLEQTGAVGEVIVVDDRSSDGTGAILARLAAADGRLRVVRVDELPSGWLGKCHALRCGASEAKGAWLLFADADVRMAPDLAARGAALCESRGADHLALLPRLSGTSAAVRPCLLLPMLGLYERAPGVHRRKQPARTFVGVGAFNMVRRAVYDAFGGHEALRMEVIDDLKLGLLVGRAGGRTLLREAGQMRVPYITSIPRLFHVVEKNLFALFRFSLWRTALMAALLLSIWLGALLGPVAALGTGTVVGWFAPACLWASAVPAAMAARRQGWSVWWALAAPLTAPLPVAAGLNSALRATARGGIVWRGTRYGLAELRRGAVW